MIHVFPHMELKVVCVLWVVCLQWGGGWSEGHQDSGLTLRTGGSTDYNRFIMREWSHCKTCEWVTRERMKGWMDGLHLSRHSLEGRWGQTTKSTLCCSLLIHWETASFRDSCTTHTQIDPSLRIHCIKSTCTKWSSRIHCSLFEKVDESDWRDAWAMWQWNTMKDLPSTSHPDCSTCHFWSLTVDSKTSSIHSDIAHQSLRGVTMTRWHEMTYLSSWLWEHCLRSLQLCDMTRVDDMEMTTHVWTWICCCCTRLCKRITVDSERKNVWEGDIVTPL